MPNKPTLPSALFADPLKPEPPGHLTLSLIATGTIATVIFIASTWNLGDPLWKLLGILAAAILVSNSYTSIAYYVRRHLPSRTKK